MRMSAPKVAFRPAPGGPRPRSPGGPSPRPSGGPRKKRGFFGSWLEFGTLAGYIGGAGLVVTALIGATGNMMMPASYMMAAAVIGGVAVWFMTESAGRPLPGSPPSVEPSVR